MTGGAYELLTVSGAAEVLMKSEGGVRRLIKAGKLKPLREGRRVLLTPEELERYTLTLPHPIWVMAAIYEARAHLAAFKSLGGTGWRSLGMDYLTPQVSAYRRHFLPLAVPVCRDLLAAVKVKDYAKAGEHEQELWRVQSDYQMLYAPIKTPQHKPKKKQARPAAVQAALFPSDGGGTV